MEGKFEDNLVDFVRYIQFERKLSTVQLSNATGVSVHVLRNIRDLKTPINEDRRDKIFKALGVTLDEFIDFVTINNLKTQIKGEF